MLQIARKFPTAVQHSIDLDSCNTTPTTSARGRRSKKERLGRRGDQSASSAGLNFESPKDKRAANNDNFDCKENSDVKPYDDKPSWPASANSSLAVVGILDDITRQPAATQNNKQLPFYEAKPNVANDSAQRPSTQRAASSLYTTPQAKVSIPDAAKKSQRLGGVFSRPMSDREFLQRKDATPTPRATGKHAALNLETPGEGGFSTP